MRLLHLFAGNLYGGVERMLVTLAQAQTSSASSKMEFGFCFEGRVSQQLRDMGNELRPLGRVRLSRPWTVWRGRRRLSRLIREQKYDAVMCHGSWPHIVFAPVVRARGAKLIYFAHLTFNRSSWLDRKAWKLKPDVIVANSEFTKRSFEPEFPEAQLCVVHCPVSAPAPLGADSRYSVRKSLDCPPDAIVILMAARMEAWKGHERLIEAVAALKTELPWRVWFAGGVQRESERPYFDRLQRLASQHGLEGPVRFLGDRTDVPALMAASDIYCQPNTSGEPFGISFVEALFAGIPVVASNVGGGAEVINDACGILCPPGDVAAVAAALERLIESPALRRQLGEAGPARANSISNASQQVERLYAAIALV